MALYARGARRLGQLGGDLFLVGWVALWWWLSRVTRAALLRLAGPARNAAAAAEQVSDQVRETAAQASRVPGLGEQLRRPLDGAAGSLGGVVAALDGQVAGIERLASLAGWLVLALPVSLLLLVWVPRRVRFVVESRAARRLLDAGADLDLFALRALASQPLSALARVSDDPLRAWREGDATVISRLAEGELRRHGLRPPGGRGAR